MSLSANQALDETSHVKLFEYLMLPFSSAILISDQHKIDTTHKKSKCSIKMELIKKKITNQTANSFYVMVSGLIIYLRFKIH